MKIFIQKLSSHIGHCKENIPQAITKKKIANTFLISDNTMTTLHKSHLILNYNKVLKNKRKDVDSSMLLAFSFFFFYVLLSSFLCTLFDLYEVQLFGRLLFFLSLTQLYYHTQMSVGAAGLLLLVFPGWTLNSALCKEKNLFRIKLSMNTFL